MIISSSEHQLTIPYSFEVFLTSDLTSYKRMKNFTTVIPKRTPAAAIAEVSTGRAVPSENIIVGLVNGQYVSIQIQLNQ